MILFQHLRTERLIGIQPCECGALSFGEVRLQVESKMLYLVLARHTQSIFVLLFLKAGPVCSIIGWKLFVVGLLTGHARTFV